MSIPWWQQTASSRQQLQYPLPRQQLWTCWNFSTGNLVGLMTKFFNRFQNNHCLKYSVWLSILCLNYLFTSISQGLLQGQPRGQDFVTPHEGDPHPFHQSLPPLGQPPLWRRPPRTHSILKGLRATKPSQMTSLHFLTSWPKETMITKNLSLRLFDIWKQKNSALHYFGSFNQNWTPTTSKVMKPWWYKSWMYW